MDEEERVSTRQYTRGYLLKAVQHYSPAKGGARPPEVLGAVRFSYMCHSSVLFLSFCSTSVLVKLMIIFLCMSISRTTPESHALMAG